MTSTDRSAVNAGDGRTADIASSGRRRVAVTGVGVVAPCGIGQVAFWDGLLAVPTDERRRDVAEFDPLVWFAPKDARRTDRFAQLAVAAAEMARESAGLPERPEGDPLRHGVIVGTGVGGLSTLEAQGAVLADRGERRVSPFTIPMIMPNAAGAAISMRWGWCGPNETITTACAAGTHAISYAARLVASGRCDRVLVAGTESVMTPVTLAGFTNMTALSSSGRSAPFSAGRDGFCIAEGAGALVLEREDLAVARGAGVLAVVAGSASTADAHHLTAPSPGGVGAAACLRLAIDDAGLTPDQVVHVNAHGTSTPLNDAAEAAALATVFSDRQPVVTSIKGVTGHSLGAAGALEAVAVVLSMQHGLIPPTAGTCELDPALPPLDLVLGAPRAWTPGPTLSSSFGFGGHNGVLVLLPA